METHGGGPCPVELRGVTYMEGVFCRNISLGESVQEDASVRFFGADLARKAPKTNPPVESKLVEHPSQAVVKVGEDSDGCGSSEGF